MLYTVTNLYTGKVTSSHADIGSAISALLSDAANLNGRTGKVDAVISRGGRPVGFKSGAGRDASPSERRAFRAAGLAG